MERVTVNPKNEVEAHITPRTNNGMRKSKASRLKQAAFTEQWVGLGSGAGAGAVNMMITTTVLQKRAVFWASNDGE